MVSGGGDASAAEDPVVAATRPYLLRQACVTCRAARPLTSSNDVDQRADHLVRRADGRDVGREGMLSGDLIDPIAREVFGLGLRDTRGCTLEPAGGLGHA